MSEWKKVKIGDFLKRKRIPVQLEADKEYKLITIKLYHKGVFLRCNKKGSEIHSNMYKVSKGDFILSGIDARNGAFGIIPDSLDGAIVTNDFWYFDIDESIIKKEFFLWLTSTPVFLDACQKSSMGETQRIRLQKDAFFNYQINCPSIEYQDDFLAKINPIIEKIKTIQSETERQTEYAKLLRQNILQEAIEGKLTADWRKQNPVQKGNPDYDAEALFEQIQKGEDSPSLQPASQFSATPSAGSNAARNARSKSLAPITDEEKPFEIPEGWKWGRFGEISINRDSERIPLSLEERENLDKIYDYYGASGIIDKVDKYLFDDTLLLIGEDGANLVNRSTPIAFIASGKFWVNNHAHVIDFDEHFIVMKYVMYFINAISLEDYITGTAQPKMNQANMNKIPVPIPPLKEQEEIVNNVETLLAKVTTLETQIQNRKSLSDKLIFGIIKENLEG